MTETSQVRKTASRVNPYLKGVCKEIMVEHRPILATNVYNDFTKLVTDEIGHRFVLSKEELGKTAANLHLVLGSNSNPQLVYQVLKIQLAINCKTCVQMTTTYLYKHMQCTSTLGHMLGPSYKRLFFSPTQSVHRTPQRSSKNICLSIYWNDLSLG